MRECKKNRSTQGQSGGGRKPAARRVAAASPPSAFRGFVWDRTSGLAAGLLAAWVVLACGAASAGEKAKERPKKIYAHYMACYPVAAWPRAASGPTTPIKSATMGPASSTPSATVAELAPRARRHEIAAGPERRPGDPPGPPRRDRRLLHRRLGRRRRGEERLRRPVRGGRGEGLSLRDQHLPRHFVPAGRTRRSRRSVDAIREMLDKHGKSPKLARRDGKPLVAGYNSIFVGLGYAERTPWATCRPGGARRICWQDPRLPHGSQGVGRLTARLIARSNAASASRSVFHFCMNALFMASTITA